MSNFVVSARKYRPQRFEDVVGQEHVSKTLKNALQTDHLAHAFLFCGPRGVGKTTCARILAKVLNCENPTKDFEPCNQCESCKAFSHNASFNITELDAASNNSVEHIRALIEQVRFQPQQGKYKIFIIDEVHMLSQAAFNAFLKTLEEPPAYAIFILATTEKHKIIPTILSRCQIFDFRRIQVADTVAHLAEICREEGIQADHDALHIVAQKADGALRDALSIFDRIVSFSGKRVTYEDVISNLNVLDYDYFFRVMEALLTEDLTRTMLIFDEIIRKGFEPDLFINGLAEHARNLLVCKDAETLSLLEVGDSLRDRYRQQARISPAAFLLTLLNLANDCDINYRMARSKRLHVEMCLLKMASIGRAFRPDPALALASPLEKKRPDDPLTAPRTAEMATTTPVPSVEPTPMPDPVAATASEQTTPPRPESPAEPEPPAVEEPPEEEEAPPIEEPVPARENEMLEKPAPEPDADKAGNGQAAGNVGAARGRRKTPRADIHSLLAEIREDLPAAQDAVTAISAQAAQAAWDKYLQQAEREVVRHHMQNAKLLVEELQLTAKVTSRLAESAIREEAALMDFLRHQLRAPQLSLVIDVDESLRPTDKATRPKALSARDKYLLLREANPAVDLLRKRFDLRPDEA